MSVAETSSINLNALIIVSELAVLFGIVIIVLLFLEFRKRRKIKRLALEFLENLKTNTGQREQIITTKIEDATSLDESEKSNIIEALITSEKSAYLHIAQLFMGYKPDTITILEEELKSISGNYFSLMDKMVANAVGGVSSVEEDDDSGAMRELKKQVSQLRDEKKALKEKNNQLQTDFDASMKTLENMTIEFANMYEGGSKDGEKKIKNEMYQLKQKLGEKAESPEDDEVADEVSADDIDDVLAGVASETPSEEGKDAVQDLDAPSDDAAAK